jgi:predicted KAP-like P-loop ATPase
MTEKTMSEFKDLEAALTAFEEAANEHGKATLLGNYKSVNRNYNKIIAAVKFIFSAKENTSLLIFLNHPSESVRTWAASYLFEVDEKAAVKVLEGVASGNGILAMNAETILDEWRNGTLDMTV